MSADFRQHAACLWVICTALFSSARADELVECPIIPTLRYYDITGRTVEEIRSSMVERGPLDEAGKRRFAHTEWRIKWNWKIKEDGSVNLDTLALKCEGSITLPRFREVHARAGDLASEWALFIDRLMAHESQHLSHVSMYAPRIITRLREVHGPLPPARANMIVQEVVAEIKAMDRDYDRITRNGDTEGCWRIGDTLLRRAE